jgi:hypothetical protein
MTADENLLVFDIEFTRRKNETAVELIDEIYSASYKKLFNNYKYQLKQSFVKLNKDLPPVARDYRSIELNQTFDDFHVYFFKSEIRFVLVKQNELV